MAYEPGNATSPTDLLQKLVTWLVSRGWIQNMSQADGNGWRAHLSKNGIYVNLRSNIGSGASSVWAGGNYASSITGIGIYLGTGFSSGSAWNAQAGGPKNAGNTYTLGSWMALASGSITSYKFFDDGADNIAVIVERTSGLFTHLCWGPSLVKAGTWTGGAYFSAAMSSYFGSQAGGEGSAESVSVECPFGYMYGTANAFVRVDVDSFTGKWVGLTETTTENRGYTGKQGFPCVVEASTGSQVPADIPRCFGKLRTRCVSSMNSQVVLLPNRIFVARDSGGYSGIGTVPGIYPSYATTKGFQIGSTISIGSDTFMVFPNFVVKKVS